MLLLDRYFAGRAGAIAIQILLLVILLLTVENLTRLLDLVGDVESPMITLVRMMTALIPEYVAIGTFFALYLGIGLTVRDMCMRGEWAILSATGQSPLRRLLMPCALGIAGALLLLGIRLELQPRGEQQLDYIGQAAAAGQLGMAFDIGEFVSLPGGGTLTIDHFDRPSQTAHGIFLTGDDLTVTAPLATISHYQGRQISIILHNGSSLQRDRPAVRFSRMQILVNRDASLAANINKAAPEKLDRLPLARLWQRVGIERIANQRQYPATSSLAARLANGLFCLLIPLLALATAELPPRKSSGFGLAVGMLAIVGFIKGLAWVEAGAGAWPVAAIGAYMALWAILIGAVYGTALRQPGQIEQVLSAVLEKPWAWLVANMTR